MEIGWAMRICPLCRINRENKLFGLLRKVVDASTKEKHLEACVYLEAAKYDGWPKKTLREDYELGINEDGIYQASYYCYCGECGFKFGNKNRVGARLVSSWTEAQIQAKKEQG